MSQRRPLVPNPCHEDWDKLTPEERGHFCTVCETKVWDLSALTRAEAEEFLRSTEGDLCVSYRERANGEVVHRDAPVVPLSRLMKRLPAAAGFSLALAACTPTGSGADGADTAEVAKPDPKPDPKLVDDEHAKPPDDEEAPTTAVDEPPPPPDPEEQHVKGKWAPPDEDAPEGKKPEEPEPEVDRDRGPKPHVKKGKVARPHD